MTRGRYWRFWRQPELGLMFGPIPVAFLLVTVGEIAVFVYFRFIAE